MQESTLRRTPLYPLYEQLGAKIVDFAGWAMPVQFTGIMDEHHSVRRAAGLFDVSHMGEIELRGSGAQSTLQRLVTNDVARIVPGRAIYSPMCRDDGGVIDDLLIYCLSVDHYLLVVNAANLAKDLDHITAVADTVGECRVDNVTERYAVLALQGPRAASVLGRLISVRGGAGATGHPTFDLKPFRFVESLTIGGYEVAIVSRTGYTGEDGFELYMAPEHAVPIWEALMAAGRDDGLVAAGLGARDTLRFEACFPLYGNELTEETNPIEAGLSRFVKIDKGSFIGREALVSVMKHGATRRLVGLEMFDRGLPRQGYTVSDATGLEIGFVTSGGLAPTLGTHLALAYVPTAFSALGTEVAIMIRGNPRRARVVTTPFYRRS